MASIFLVLWRNVRTNNSLCAVHQGSNKSCLLFWWVVTIKVQELINVGFFAEHYSVDRTVTSWRQLPCPENPVFFFFFSILFFSTVVSTFPSVVHLMLLSLLLICVCSPVNVPSSGMVCVLFTYLFHSFGGGSEVAVELSVRATPYRYCRQWETQGEYINIESGWAGRPEGLSKWPNLSTLCAGHDTSRRKSEQDFSWGQKLFSVL